MELLTKNREQQQREREQREKEQREKEQREFLEKEERERERHLAQLYAAEMQRQSLLLSGQFQAASQRPSHSIGLGLAFPPNVHGIPPHMAHPFGHIAAMTGFPSLSHTSPIPGSYTYQHTSPSNPSSSLNLSHNRNNTAPSPVESASKSRSTAPSPAHSASNIPSISAALPKHYPPPPPHKYTESMKKHSPHPTSTAPSHDPYNISGERYANNSSNNRNSSNHSNSNSSHFNAESLNVPKSTEQLSFNMHDRVPKPATSPFDVATNCKYSISLEKINSKSVTSNETRSEPMRLSVSSDAPQAKFNTEQISPRKLHLISDNKLKSMHFTNNDELNNGCQERSIDVKDLSGRFSSYGSRHHHHPFNDAIVLKSDENSANTSKTLTIRSDLHAAQSPDNLTLSKEPIVTTNSTSLEHDSTISNSDKQQIANNKDNMLSKLDAGDIERYHTNTMEPNNAWAEHNMGGSTENDAAAAAKSTTMAKSPHIESPKSQPDETGCDTEKSPSHAAAAATMATDLTAESLNDTENVNKASEHGGDDGTAVAVENSEPTKQTTTT